MQDFCVYTWNLSNWRKLEKKITSPEFECGGHRWYVSLFLSFCPVFSHVHKAQQFTLSISFLGEYYFSPLAIRMRHLMTLSRSTLTMRTQSELQTAGMLALNSRSSFPILMTQLFTQSPVSCRLSRYNYALLAQPPISLMTNPFTYAFVLFRCTPPFHS